MPRRIGRQDQLIAIINGALHVVAGARPTASPAAALPEPELSPTATRLSGQLMRVNRAGEVAAQALYRGQAVFARNEATRAQLNQAAVEEEAHLAWCTERLRELETRPSLLDPLWYVGNLGLGLLAGLAGDAASLGFIAETEKQVEAHLSDHLSRLPAADSKSRAILERMAEDEAKHGRAAEQAGGHEPPEPIRRLMGLGGEMLRQFSLHL